MLQGCQGGAVFVVLYTDWNLLPTLGEEGNENMTREGLLLKYAIKYWSVFLYLYFAYPFV